MAGFNASEWSLRNRALVLFIMLVVAFAAKG